MAYQRLKMAQKWSKNSPKRAEKTSKWGQNDTKTSPRWCQNDPKMIPKWPQTDTGSTQKWSKITPKSPQTGPKVGHFRPKRTKFAFPRCRMPHFSTLAQQARAFGMGLKLVILHSRNTVFMRFGCPKSSRGHPQDSKTGLIFTFHPHYIEIWPLNWPRDLRDEFGINPRFLVMFWKVDCKIKHKQNGAERGRVVGAVGRLRGRPPGHILV